MLITSFAPLWIAIAFIIAWDVAADYSVLIVEHRTGIEVDYSDEACVNVAELIIQTLQGNTSQLAFAGAVLLVLLVSTLYILSFVRRIGKLSKGGDAVKIVLARKSTSLVTDFLLFYVLPMIAFDFSNLRDILLFLIYFAFIAFLSIRNGNVYTNVLFEFIGYRAYKCDVEKGVMGKTFKYSECTVISKFDLTSNVGHEFTCFDFENTTFLNLEKPKKGASE
jgi:hypothetical protein